MENSKDHKAAAEPPLDYRVMPHRFHILFAGKALCPCCGGAGVEQSAATTYAKTCDYCDGDGVVRCRGA